jgi:hypothetical protein
MPKGISNHSQQTDGVPDLMWNLTDLIAVHQSLVVMRIMQFINENQYISSSDRVTLFYFIFIWFEPDPIKFGSKFFDPYILPYILPFQVISIEVKIGESRSVGGFDGW